MPNRHSDKERWEVYLMMILLRMRPLIFIGALIIFFYGVVALFAYPLLALVALALALFLFMIVLYDRVTLYVARFGAWLVTTE